MAAGTLAVLLLAGGLRPLAAREPGPAAGLGALRAELAALPWLAAVDSAALDSAGRATSGGPPAAGALRGRPLLVHLWASWAPPCREEMRHLRALRTARGDTAFTVLSLAVDAEGADPVRRFLRGFPVPWPVAAVGREGARRWAARLPQGEEVAVPMRFLFDASGVLRHASSGYRDHAWYRSALDAVAPPRLPAPPSPH